MGHFGHVERKRRLEIIHQERLAAMDKGIPLPELPLDPSRIQKGPDPRATLVHGIVWSALGIDSMIVRCSAWPSRFSARSSRPMPKTWRRM